MATEIVGKCFICGKELFAHDMAPNEVTGEPKKAVHYSGWPKTGIACLAHPGIEEEYKAALLHENKKLQERLDNETNRKTASISTA